MPKPWNDVWCNDYYYIRHNDPATYALRAAADATVLIAPEGPSREVSWDDLIAYMGHRPPTDGLPFQLTVRNGRIIRLDQKLHPRRRSGVQASRRAVLTTRATRCERPRRLNRPAGPAARRILPAQEGPAGRFGA